MGFACDEVVALESCAGGKPSTVGKKPYSAQKRCVSEFVVLIIIEEQFAIKFECIDFKTCFVT